ncbi:hypothetical protein ES705_24229 [subsurface metagenome]
MANLFYQYYIILIPVSIITLYFLLKYPEISLALFINAYVIKGGINFGYFNLTAILLIVTVVGFILKQLFNKDKNAINLNFKLEPPDKFIFLFVAILVIGCIYSLNRNVGIIKALRFIVIVFVPYLLARIFLVKGNQIKLFLISISIIALVIGFLYILRTVLVGSSGRIRFFYANPIPVGTVFMVGLTIFIVGITQNMFNKNKYGKFFSIMAIVLLLYSLFLISTRGPLISMITGLFFYFLIIFREKAKWKNIGVITIILFSLIFIWISYSDIIFTNPTINKIIPNAGRLSITSAKGMSDRIKIYSAAWQLFKNKPFFGLGTGGFPGGGYPHNIILEIAAENGLLGLLIFFGFLFTICQKGYQFLNNNFIKINKQAKIMGLVILVVSVSLFVGRQFSFGLDMHKDLFVFLGLIVNLPLIDWGRNQDKMFLEKD